MSFLETMGDIVFSGEEKTEIKERSQVDFNEPISAFGDPRSALMTPGETKLHYGTGGFNALKSLLQRLNGGLNKADVADVKASTKTAVATADAMKEIAPELKRWMQAETSTTLTLNALKQVGLEQSVTQIESNQNFLAAANGLASELNIGSRNWNHNHQKLVASNDSAIAKIQARREAIRG
jgi:hypothetical protein